MGSANVLELQEKSRRMCAYWMVKYFLFILIGAFVLTTLVHGQDQTGFISIDCGIANMSSYIDGKTGIEYVSDAEFTDAGVSQTISDEYNTSDLDQQFRHVRSFPQGIKNCYTITLPQFNGRTKYLARARFLYGNYDGMYQLPTFDMYLGVHYWDTVIIYGNNSYEDFEIIHIFSTEITSVCLVNTGQGVPFISAIELRLVDSQLYVARSGSLALFARSDLRLYIEEKDSAIRYEDDIFDRIWEGPFHSTWLSQQTQLNTSLTISTDSKDIYKVPSVVMATAASTQNANGSMDINWYPDDPDNDYYFYMHFAEIKVNTSREFNIYINGTLWNSEVIVPEYLSTTTVYSISPSRVVESFNFSIKRTDKTLLPPILNAIEIYMVKDLSSLQTYKGDVDAIQSVKSVYGLKKNWQGDPCTPEAYSWEGLTCINDSSTPLRVISLNLSSSGLTGNISIAISDLKLLQSLDLSNNSLNGEVPDFLSKMENLTVLKLSGNNLIGTVPAELAERTKSGSLWLSIEGNPNLCMLESCKINHKNNMRVTAIAVSVAVVLVIFIAVFISWVFIQKKRKQQRVRKVGQVANETKFKGRPVDTTNRQFTYSEVLVITNNLASVIGKGGFGPVYHGYLGGTEVAVKMLSLSSDQGYKEFCAEIEILTRIHHKNLTSLVGFCDEGSNIGLIYEYLANGNLKNHLSDTHQNVPSWKERLRMAVDAATGLEYLHNGCKPPIIHRDVKSANILLNDKFEAKLADFGLSKAFPVDHTHVSTAVVGTLGYLDPEYYISCKLNEKSDVFSFGVVLLEIITSRAVITRDIENAHIRKWVSYMLETTEGDVTSIVDTRLGGDFEVNSVKKATEIALACASPTSNQRPTMSHVVAELKQSLLTELDRVNEGREGSSLNFDSESSLVGR